MNRNKTEKLTLENATGFSSAFVKRVDENHANPKKLWTQMGKPEYLSAAQVEQLEEASCQAVIKARTVGFHKVIMDSIKVRLC